MYKKRNYIYRFKTKDEFITDYGPKWRNLNEYVNFPDQMDYLLGTDINKCFYNSINNKQKFTLIHRCGNWNIIPMMIIKEQNIPNYKPKTFIH